jgi:hypothetical protein
MDIFPEWNHTFRNCPPSTEWYAYLHPARAIGADVCMLIVYLVCLNFVLPSRFNKPHGLGQVNLATLYFSFLICKME